VKNCFFVFFCGFLGWFLVAFFVFFWDVFKQKSEKLVLVVFVRDNDCFDFAK